MDDKHTPAPLAAALPPTGRGQGPLLDSRTLFAGASQLWIRHGGELYRLQLTRNNRLILIK
jgi:hemin uptake protein HemP